MTRNWEITIWGVRGSFPKSTMNSQLFGGNTSCISVAHGETAIVLDAGSGLARYAESFHKEKYDNRLNILISHPHIDHIMGLFYFSAMFDPDLEIHFYGCEKLAEYLENLVRKPYWPVSFQDFPTKVTFHRIAAGDSFQIDDVRVETMAANHPDDGLLYRLTDGEKTLVHALDNELTPETEAQLTEFCRQCDVLFWDANFTAETLIPGWGHSTWEQGLAMRGACGAKQVVMTHYNWFFTDEQLLEMEQTATAQDPCCRFAKEGATI